MAESQETKEVLEVPRVHEYAKEYLHEDAHDVSLEALVKDYMYSRAVLRLFNMKAALSDVEWEEKKDGVGVHSGQFKKAGVDIAEVNSSQTAMINVTDDTGEMRKLQIIQLETKSGEISWIARATRGGLDSNMVALGRPIHIDERGANHYARTAAGIGISSEVSLYPQQNFGINAYQRAVEELPFSSDIASETQKMQTLVFATGTGKSFVMIAPAIAQGRGVYVVPNFSAAEKLEKDIRLLDIDERDKDNIIISTAVGSKGEEDTLKSNKHIIIVAQDLERFTPHMGGETIYMDEEHTYSDRDIEGLIDIGGRILAVTATPSGRFGEPIGEINLFYALEEMKAFRDIENNVLVFDKDDSFEDKAFKDMVEYYSGMTYIEGDNRPKDRKKIRVNIEEDFNEARGDPDMHPRHSKNIILDNLAEKADAILRSRGIEVESDLSHDSLMSCTRSIMAANEVRRTDMINAAYATDKEALATITKAYQAVFEGTYDRGEKLAEEVSASRTTTRIKEAMKIENQLLGLLHEQTNDVPEHIDISDDSIRTKYKGLIKDSTVDAAALQREAEHTLKKHIADSLNRKIIGIFRDNTSEGDMRQIQVDGDLHNKLEHYTSGDTDSSPVQSETLHRMEDRSKKSPYTMIAEALGPIDRKDSILKAIDAGDYKKLELTADDIDLEKIPEASYAARVPEADEEDGKYAREEKERVANAITGAWSKSFIVHMINDTRNVEGVSNPDCKSVQRRIERVIARGVIRAVQILGRGIRDFEDILFATESVGHEINLDGKIGIDRPFLFDDAKAENYLELFAMYKDACDKAHPDPKPEHPGHSPEPKSADRVSGIEPDRGSK